MKGSTYVIIYSLMISTSWWMVVVTTSATVLGCSQVFLDKVCNRLFGTNFSILESQKFLGGSLSLSSGTLLVTSLNGVMPSALSYIDDSPHEANENTWLFCSVFAGLCCCLMLNYLVHHIITHSAINCPHILSHKSSPTETTELLANANSSSLPSEFPRTKELHIFVVAVQTVLAIAIHRVPEGFLIYATVDSDKQLGMNLVLALTMHSFCEGFSIVAPLCSAFGSRIWAVIIASILGGGSQPFGAAIAAYMASIGLLPVTNFFVFGIYMGITAGFMLIISLELLTTAVELVGSNFAIAGCASGVFLVLLSRCI